MPSITTYLNAKHIQQIHKGKILVIVENEDDIPFWKRIFEHFGIASRICAGISTKKRTQRGKEAVLKQEKNTNKQYVLCVDSDYDYLTQNNKHNIHTNPFIFQTYTYSYENYTCLPHSLTGICNEICLSDDFEFDFVAFFEKYSSIIYPLFLCHLYDKIYHNGENLPISTFYQCIDLPQHPKIHANGSNILANIKHKVSQKLTEITIPSQDLKALEIELIALGLSHNNSYLFLRGHNIFDNTVKIIEQICYPIISAQKSKLYAKNKDKYHEYVHNIKDVKTVLILNKLYQNSELFSKIENDFITYKVQS